MFDPIEAHKFFPDYKHSDAPRRWRRGRPDGRRGKRHAPATEPRIQDRTEEVAQPQRSDRWFNPLRAPRSEKLREVIATVTARLARYELKKGWRKRARRPNDQRVFERTVSAILCDLIFHELLECSDKAVAFSRSNQLLGKASRYKPVAINKALPTVVDLLARSQFRYVKAVKGGKAFFEPSTSSHMTPGIALLKLIERHELGFEDLGETCDQETVVLKRPKADYWDQGGKIEYEETQVTQRFRHQMGVINRWIAAAAVDVDPVVMNVYGAHDPTELALRRVFTQGRFDSGGRLFGGYWQKLSKYERKHWITIDAEQVTALDFSQMAPRLLYGRIGAAPALDDAYTLPGYEQHRDGVKQVFNAMLFSKTPLRKMPKGVGDKFRRGTRIDIVVAAIQRAHEPIAEHFLSGVGHDLQFMESELLVDLLLRLKDLGHVALPVHDAVVVKESVADCARAVMEELFLQHTGLPGIVTEE